MAERKLESARPLATRSTKAAATRLSRAMSPLQSMGPGAKGIKLAAQLRLDSKRGANPLGCARAQAWRAVTINWAYGTKTTVRAGETPLSCSHSFSTSSLCVPRAIDLLHRLMAQGIEAGWMGAGSSKMGVSVTMVRQHRLGAPGKSGNSSRRNTLTPPLTDSLRMDHGQRPDQTRF